MAAIERSLQKLVEKLDADHYGRKLAEKLGVNYYRSFKVLKVDGVKIGPSPFWDPDLFFPIAEVYEKGKWRELVIAGRPYHEESVARSIVDGAANMQVEFLKVMSEVEKSADCFHLIGLANPIDHCRYHLEQ